MLDLSSLVIAQGQNFFARPVTVTPHRSQPGKLPYSNRGIFTTTPMDVMTEGNVVFSDQRTGLKIRVADYAVMPKAGDYVEVHGAGTYPPQGVFEIQDVDEWA